MRNVMIRKYCIIQIYRAIHSQSGIKAIKWYDPRLYKRQRWPYLKRKGTKSRQSNPSQDFLYSRCLRHLFYPSGLLQMVRSSRWSMMKSQPLSSWGLHELPHILQPLSLTSWNLLRISIPLILHGVGPLIWAIFIIIPWRPGMSFFCASLAYMQWAYSPLPGLLRNMIDALSVFSTGEQGWEGQMVVSYSVVYVYPGSIPFFSCSVSWSNIL